MSMHVNRSLLMRAGAAGALVVVLALGAGCGAKKGKLPATAGDPDKYLFERGTESLVKKRWLKAREYFRQLSDNYPQSPYRPDAKIGLGDTYLGEASVEALILGANEFREFLTFFPTHQRADYAQYKLALAYYEQMLAPLRDQTQTKQAVKEFENFVERYPNSTLIKEGRAKLRACHDRLSDADYQIGVFYYRSRWYPGAVVRLRIVLNNDPGYSNRDAVYYYLAECYVKMRLAAEALPLLDRLEKEFGKSDFVPKARKLVVEIQNAPPEPAKPDKKKDAKAVKTVPKEAAPEKK
jgi:outer membrane protein assembly factor BamD